MSVIPRQCYDKTHISSLRVLLVLIVFLAAGSNHWLNLLWLALLAANLLVMLANCSVGLNILAAAKQFSNPQYASPNIILSPTLATLSISFLSCSVVWQNQAGAPSQKTDKTCFWRTSICYSKHPPY